MNEELIIKYIAGEADQEERLRVENWIAENSGNKREFERMEKLWKAFGDRGEEAPQIDLDMVWADFLRKRDARENRLHLLHSRRKRRTMSALGAAAALLVFCTLGFWTLRAVLSVENTLKTAMQVQHAELPDGSTAHLNTHAEMTYRKNWLGRDRKVHLVRGEVFFDVSRDPEHPFVIESGKSKITVLGTSFHVRREGTDTEVIVASGSVKVAHGRQELVLKPDQMVVVSDTAKKEIRVKPVPDQLYRYYVHEEFMFENTPLQRVFDVLGKAYGKKFLIQDPQTKTLPYTATFEQQSLKDMLEVILKTFDLKMQHRDSVYYIN